VQTTLAGAAIVRQVGTCQVFDFPLGPLIPVDHARQAPVTGICARGTIRPPSFSLLASSASRDGHICLSPPKGRLLNVNFLAPIETVGTDKSTPSIEASLNRPAVVRCIFRAIVDA
jgi:hypothetical protein